MTRLFAVRLACTAAAAALAGVFVMSAVAATGHVVPVDLVDTSSKPAAQGMRVKPAAAKVKAGDVVFQVTNRSGSLVHEMLVVKLDKSGQALPYDAKEDKLEEDGIKSLGEVPELEPGKSGVLKIKLAPGVYALLCNQPGHYQAGMVTNFTVTP